ncbi:MAG: hypothetical protein JXR76_05260 [Deltaproteobacteria bacterium]|nr:hypothetical protein [Deltaproteobacteria bacterium]
MKVAVPLFGSDVAPRFGEADRFLVAESYHGTVRSREVVEMDRIGDWMFRLSELEMLGVKVLLCCGFNRYYWPLAIERGIRVITGATGDAQTLVNAFVHGEKLPLLPCCASPEQIRYQCRIEHRREDVRMQLTSGFNKRKD